MVSDDKLFQSVKEKWQEVVEIPPQTMGPLTPVYKRAVPFLKVHPWRVLIIASMLLALFFYLVFDVSLVHLVSILQKGI